MMKTNLKIFTLGLLTLLAFRSTQAQDDLGAARLQYQCTVEYQTATTNRHKCGFAAFVDPCPLKTVVYKRQSVEWGGFTTGRNMDVNGVGSGGTATLNAGEEQYCDPTTSNTICVNWSGAYTSSGWNNTSHNNPQTNSNSAILISCDEWNTNYAMIDCGICIGTTFQTENLRVTSCTSGQTNDDDNFIIESSCTNYTVYTLSDEYTTQELLSASGLEYSGGWMSGTPSASTSITDNEKTAEIKKTRFRFKIVAPTGQPIHVAYYEHYLVAGSTNEIVSSPKFINGIGTGSPTYYPENGPIEIDPPHGSITNGNCIYTVGAQKWIVVRTCNGSASVRGKGTANDDDRNMLAKASLNAGSLSKRARTMAFHPTRRKLVRCSLYGSRPFGQGLGSTCRSCSASPGSVTAELSDYGLSISAHLGRDSFGDGAGSLMIAGATPQPNLVTPAGLEYFGNLGSIELIRNDDGSLRQAKSVQVLADIVINSSTSYTITCYSSSQVGGKDQNGLYIPPGSPISVTTIAQGGSTNEILVTVANGVTNVYDFTWSVSDQGWTLSSGDGLRREIRKWNPSILVGTNTIRDANNRLVYQEVQYFKNLDSRGHVITKRVVGPEGPALTAQWFYYEDAQTDGTNYGKVKLRIEPSGFWTRYEYDSNGWITKEVSQFLNAPTNAPESQCRVILHDYTPVVTNCACELRTEQLLGQEISRQYTLNFGSEIVTIQCQTPGNTNLSAGDNLVTVSRNYYDGDFVGKLRTVTHPDGTMEIYSYETNNTLMTTTVLSGQPDSTGTTVVDGTQTVTETGLAGEISSRTVTDIASPGIMTAWDTYYYNDDLNRSYTVFHYNGTYEQVQYACCGIDSATDPDGTLTQYTYDALKRQVAFTRNGITTSNVLDAVGNVLATIRIGSDGSPMFLHQAAYDVAGRLTAETNALDGATLYAWSVDASGQTLKTTTYPDGGTRIETSFEDGRVEELSGSAVSPARYEYGVENESGLQRAYTREIKLAANGIDTSEWTKGYTDMLGRPYKTLFADGATSSSFFNAQGQRVKEVDPDGVTTLYQYNGKGELEYTAIDLNTNGVIDFAGADRITRTTSDVLFDANNGNVRRTRTYSWTIPNQDSPVLTTTTETALTTVHTWITYAGLTTDTQTTFGGGQRWVSSYGPDRSSTVTTFQNGQVLSVSRSDGNGNPLGQISYGYDSYGRQNTITEQRSDGAYVTTTKWLNNAGQVSATLTPSPDGNQPGQLTTNYFDTMGRIWKTTLSDNTSVTNEYFPTGLLKRTYGSRTYPVAYTYDAQGRMTTMTTWQGFAAKSGLATTVWNYDPFRGWLNSKIYSDGHGPSYTYTAAGRLKTRRWARGITTTYGYDNGLLSTVAYSDSTEPMAYGYDRSGRQTTITQGAITTSRAYDDAGNLVTEAYSGGFLAGLSITNGYDEFLRRINLVLLKSSNPLIQQSFTYDAASRLQSATDNTGPTLYTGAYTYLANSPLVGQIEFRDNDAVVMSTFKQYDYLNRLTSISSSTNGQQSFFGSSHYQLNSAGQRTALTNADGTFWVYHYDSLGQAISAQKFWPDGPPVAGQQFTYSFDDIGNRRSSATGGDLSGVNLRSQDYSANSLNQYRQRAVPGYLQVLGSANSNAVVSLWGSDGSYAVACQQADYFRAELAQNNRTGAVWLTLTNMAVLASGGTSDILTNSSGNVFLARTPEAYGYDADGNLTSDGRWAYTWDAENRLTSMQSLSTAPAGSKLRLVFSYDYLGRRTQKIVSAWSGSAYVAQNTNTFLYDGLNLVCELDGVGSALRSYLWGLDLSGSTQGAGGAGGLLAVCQFSNGQVSACHFVACQGNGNVGTLVNAYDDSISCQYEYGPFGEILRATGPVAKSNPFRFSTRYQDVETDLVYYLPGRYYVPSVGTWASRDPIEERGGANLYGFVHGNPISMVDLFGFAVPIYSDGPLPNTVIPASWPTVPGSGGTLQRPIVPGSGGMMGSARTGAPSRTPAEPAEMENPFSDPPSTATGAATGALQMANDLVSSAIERWVMAENLERGMKECLAQAQVGGCMGCCLIKLYRERGKYDGNDSVVYGSTRYSSKPCSLMRVEDNQNAGTDSLDPYLGRWGYRGYFPNWLEDLFGNRPEPLDNQSPWPFYRDIYPTL